MRGLEGEGGGSVGGWASGINQQIRQTSQIGKELKERVRVVSKSLVGSTEQPASRLCVSE